MCGRFLLTRSSDEISRLLSFPLVPDLVPRYNIAPGQRAAVLYMRNGAHGAQTLDGLEWGLVPSWVDTPAAGSRIINARAETVNVKPAFREAWRRRRCVVPADGYYEWQKRGRNEPAQPFHVRRRDDRPFVFAGLWETRQEPWPDDPETFAIITTAAPPDLEDIHHRVPVILENEAIKRWLATPGDEADGLQELLRALPEGELVAEPVATTVNNVANDGPECLAPAMTANPGPDAGAAVQGDLFG